MLRIKITRIAERQEPCEAQGQDRKEGFFFCRRAARRSYFQGGPGFPKDPCYFFELLALPVARLSLINYFSFAFLGGGLSFLLNSIGF